MCFKSSIKNTIDDKLIFNKMFILNFRKLIIYFLLNIKEYEKINVDLRNFIKRNNFYERKINIINEMSKYYCYLNDD